MSPSDELKELHDKMMMWIRNGVKLAWLIFPKKKLAYIYRTDRSVTKVEGFTNTLSGEAVLENFMFDLSTLLL